MSVRKILLACVPVLSCACVCVWRRVCVRLLLAWTQGKGLLSCVRVCEVVCVCVRVVVRCTCLHLREMCVCVCVWKYVCGGVCACAFVRREHKGKCLPFRSVCEVVRVCVRVGGGQVGSCVRQGYFLFS